MTVNKTLQWQRATYTHIEDIFQIAHSNFVGEIDGLFTVNTAKFKYELAKSILLQHYSPHSEFIAVALLDGVVVGYFWQSRGSWTTFSDDEISEYKYIHPLLTLSPRLRYQFVKETLEQGLIWCATGGIPIICSTSIRQDQGGFMRLHQQLGFTVRGSYAWQRIAPPQ